MDKKGFIFVPLLVVLSLFIFGYALLMFATEERESATKVIGSMQSDSLALISESEHALLNLDNMK